MAVCLKQLYIGATEACRTYSISLPSKLATEKCVLTNSKNGTELIIPLGSIQYIETDKGNEGTD